MVAQYPMILLACLPSSRSRAGLAPACPEPPPHLQRERARIDATIKEHTPARCPPDTVITTAPGREAQTLMFIPDTQDPAEAIATR